MREKRLTVTQLSNRADLSVEDTLLLLWEAGIEVPDPGDALSGPRLRKAQEVLGIPTHSQVRRIRYWRAQFNLTTEELSTLARQLGISINPRARVLPKGLVKLLTAELRKRRGRMESHAAPQAETPSSERFPRLPVLVWPSIGHEREIRLLTTEDVLAIHQALVEDFARQSDPIDPPGVRSEHLLASAVFRPQTANGSTLKYPTIEMAGAALLHALVHDHPFHNGNKRTALVSLLVFLDGVRRSDIFLEPEDRQVYGRLLVAACEQYSMTIQAYCWMTNHVQSRPMRHH